MFARMGLRGGWLVLARVAACVVWGVFVVWVVAQMPPPAPSHLQQHCRLKREVAGYWIWGDTEHYVPGQKCYACDDGGRALRMRLSVGR